MQLWTGFLLGLMGSAHCAGMCGPLALALPHWGRDQASFVWGRLLYNLGRITTYALIGGLLGILGQGMNFAGLQRWVSLVLGILILGGLLTAPRLTHRTPIVRGTNWLKQRLGKLIQQRGAAAMLGIGLINGLLPCGLVYVAAAAAVTTGSLVGGTGYMLAFGFGTWPMLLAISLFGHKVQFTLRLRLQRLIPVTLAIVGTLLVLRGLALGIPVLSPKLSMTEPAACCH
jgi:uncharacterized protein